MSPSKVRRILCWSVSCALGLALLTACSMLSTPKYKTVYVPGGGPARLRQPLHNVKVWLPDDQGVWRESVMDIPEGWYVLDAGPTAEAAP